MSVRSKSVHVDKTKSISTSKSSSASRLHTHRRRLDRRQDGAYNPAGAEEVVRLCLNLDDSTGLGELRRLGLLAGLDRAQIMSKRRLCYHLLRGTKPALKRFKWKGLGYGAVVGGVLGAGFGPGLGSLIAIGGGPITWAVVTAGLAGAGGWHAGKKYFTFRRRKYMFLEDHAAKPLYTYKDPTEQTKRRQQRHNQDVLVRRLRHGDLPWEFPRL